MARYSYLTIIIGVCRDFNEERHAEVVEPDNPIETLYNLIDNDGKAIVEIRAVLGRGHVFDNYMYPIVDDGELKYRSCIVIRKFYLKLPSRMTRDEAIKYLEEITGIKPPVEPDSREVREFMIELYKKLRVKR